MPLGSLSIAKQAIFAKFSDSIQVKCLSTDKLSRPFHVWGRVIKKSPHVPLNIEHNEIADASRLYI